MDDEQLIKNVQAGKRRPATNKELVSFIKRTLEYIEEIKLYYKELHEGTDEEESIVTQIEEALDQIKRAHKELFEADEKGEIKTQQLNQKIEEIKQYHKQLLEGDDSIKADINDSQTHITEFYKFLFETEEGQEKDNETKTKEAIEKITNFHTKLTDKIENEVERIYKVVTEKYTDLFEASEGETSKIDQLDKNISRIKAFDDNLDKKVKPNIDEKQKYLNQLQSDIELKRKDVNSLLESATGGAIAEGYRQSMQIYAKRFPIGYEEALKGKNRFTRVLKCIYVFFHDNLLRHVGAIANYFAFIVPLIVICLIFLEVKFGGFELKINYPNGNTGTELILFKAIVSLPLLWIAWFGQSNISRRKRLFEEYNHKLRVVQMYLNFNAKDKDYGLSEKNKDALASKVLGAIDKNPAEHLGKGETMVDKLLEKFHLAGFYKQLIKDVKEELNPIKHSEK